MSLLIIEMGDLTYCDLSDALECNADFSKYIVDETTKLPIHANMDVTYSVKKYYHNRKFYVTQKWLNKSGSILKNIIIHLTIFLILLLFLKEICPMQICFFVMELTI